MRTAEILKFSWRLIRVKPGRNVVVFIALFLATLLLTLFFALSEGLRQRVLEPAAAELEADLIIATPEKSTSGGVLSLLEYFRGAVREGVSAETLAQVRVLPEVSTVALETRVPFPVATRAEIVFGVPLEFDTTVSGFSAEAARPFIAPDQSFSETEEVVPVLLSPLLIEIYNSTLAEIIPGVSKKTKDDFLGRPIEFTFGKINYLTALASFPAGTMPELRRARVVGFAPFLSPFTFAIPERVAQDMIRMYRPEIAEIKPNALLIAPTSPQAILALETKLKKLGLNVKNLSENFQTIRTTFSALQILLLSSGGIAFFLAVAFFGAVLFFSLAEQRRNIAILRVLGASKPSITLILCMFGALLGIPAVFVGALVASGLAHWANTLFLAQNFSFFFSIPGILLMTPGLLAGILLALLLLLLLIAYLPARRAAEQRPLPDL